MGDNLLQDLAVATTSAVVAAHAKDAVYIMLGIWRSIFGYHWDMKSEQIQVEHLKNLGKFRNELTQEINHIAPENIQSPKTSIAGPALEASKYYMDEDEIRQMFARLIATSMDKTRNHQAHHAYVEIIKMLSPLDAKNLYYLYTLKDKTICNRKMILDDKGRFQLIACHIWLGNPENPSQELQQVSIENLIRLGLVVVSYENYFTYENAYQQHKVHADYLSLEKEVFDTVERAKQDLDKLNQYDLPLVDSEGNIIDDDLRQKLIVDREKTTYRKAELEYGIIDLTAFGSNFCEICLPAM